MNRAVNSLATGRHTRSVDKISVNDLGVPFTEHFEQSVSIAQGVKSGQLSPGETKRLERGEQRLQHNEKKDMAKDNGHLTKQDQRHLNREENHMSKRIYKDKHNAVK